MKPQPKMRYAGAFAVLLALLAVLFVWNVNSGSLHLSVREVAQILLTHSGDNAGIVTCWYNPEGIKAPEGYRIDHEIRDLHEVYGLL